MFGVMQRKEADIAFANLFPHVEHYSYMQFSDWYTMDAACIMVPRPQPVPQIANLYLPLDAQAWFWTIFTFCSMLLFYSLLSHDQIAKLLSLRAKRGILWDMTVAIALNESDQRLHKFRAYSFR